MCDYCEGYGDIIKGDFTVKATGTSQEENDCDIKTTVKNYLWGALLFNPDKKILAVQVGNNGDYDGSNGNNFFFDKSKKIKYCPMCGRKL